MPTSTNLISRRRSIRKFSSRKVPTKILNEILQAAQWAPSAHNAQPWRFIVLTDPASKMGLAEAMSKAWNADLTIDGVATEVRKKMTEASTKRFASAPALIVACLTMQGMRKYFDSSRLKNERDLAVQSIGAAIQNLLLKAYSKNLGTCWFSAPVFCKGTVRSILGIPESIEPQALITLGYPLEKPKAPRRKSLQEIVHWERW
jgi:coenzyme F420-0:L-glutamate ligase/coenzyme F420-1:gamma-L-glutamate ligase